MLLKNSQTSASHLKELALSHACAKHAWFERLSQCESRPLGPRQIVSMLENYDAHAGLLRRLLLQAAAFMPEPAVGFVLENVRNEYGNGDYSQCHEGQLQDVIARMRRLGGIESAGSPEPRRARLAGGVRKYIRQVVDFYHPRRSEATKHFYGPAITAGAITATELMAIEEFKAMQTAFRRYDLAYHPWFDHVNVECDHGEESLALAEYFIEKHDALGAVEFGFRQTLATNVHLYDGLLEAIESNGE